MEISNYKENVASENLIRQIKAENIQISYKVMLGANMKTKPWMNDVNAINALTKQKKMIRHAPLRKFDIKGNEIV